jgi:hypothetical protein
MKEVRFESERRGEFVVLRREGVDVDGSCPTHHDMLAVFGQY